MTDKRLISAALMHPYYSKIPGRRATGEICQRKIGISGSGKQQQQHRVNP